MSQNEYNSKSVGESFDIEIVKDARRHIPSASSAMVIGGALGLIQATFLISGAKPLLSFMGIGSVGSSCQIETYFFMVLSSLIPKPGYFSL